MIAFRQRNYRNYHKGTKTQSCFSWCFCAFVVNPRCNISFGAISYFSRSQFRTPNIKMIFIAASASPESIFETPN